MMKMKFRKIGALMTAIAMACICIITPVKSQADETSEGNGTYYEHDPRLNSKAMEDIVYDPTAIYGFKPDKNSTRLGVYADYDWSDSVVVAKAVDERIAYHIENRTLYTMLETMTNEGKSSEEIGRALCAERNRIRLDSYKDNPEGLAKVKKSNLNKYGNENGPTADSLFEKYGSWDMVILKAFSTNSGMDACLGLYDIKYDDNNRTGQIKESNPAVYTVKKNDCLALIAQKYFGTQSKWYVIYKANADKIGADYVIHEGDKLSIPLD